MFIKETNIIERLKITVAIEETKSLIYLAPKFVFQILASILLKEKK